MKDQLRRGDARAELENCRCRLEGIVVVDLQLTVAGVEQEGVLPAVASNEAGLAMTIVGVRPDAGSEQRSVGRRARVDPVDDLLTVEGGAIGEADGGDALDSLVELRVELHPIALRIHNDDVAGAVALENQL